MFLSVLRKGNSAAAACKAIGISRQAMYVRRELDVEFAKQWNDAVDEGTDMLEDVALKRACKKSDTLVIFLLKGRRPEKYKDRLSTELTGKDGTPLIPVLNVTIGDQPQPPPKAG
jgi:hypothetical protein